MKRSEISEISEHSELSEVTVDSNSSSDRDKVLKLLHENTRLYMENFELMKQISRFRLKENKQKLESLNLKVDEVNEMLEKFNKDTNYLYLKLDHIR